MSKMSSITVTVPLKIRRRGGRKQIIGPDGTPGRVGGDQAETRGNPALVKVLARAFRWRRMLESGAVATVAEIAARERINASYVSRVLRLTLLAPEIVEAIMDGRQPMEMTLPVLMGPFPAEWEKQHDALTSVNLQILSIQV
ncbi:MAG: hypothetical protein AB7F35_01775 [Acetobacteraceae bacterium]